MSLSRHQAVGAYRRWEPPSFDGRAQSESGTDVAADPELSAEPLPEPAPAPIAPIEPAIQLPTADEIETMFEQAREEGRAAGYAEGAELARAEAIRLAGLTRDLDAALTRLDQDIADEIVALAIEVARQMVGHTLAVQPAAVVETVKAALAQLPQHQVRIHLHPEDVALVREHLSEHLEHGHHRLLDDTSVRRGGCRIEAPGSELDATVETRWRRIMEGLARGGTAWREPD